MSFFLHAESFSRYGSGVITGTILTQMLYRYTTVGGGQIGTTFGKNGNGITLSNSPLTRTVPHSNVWTVGFRIQAPSGSTNNVVIYKITNNDHVMFQLRYNVDGTLTMFAGAGTTLIGTTERALLNTRWYWIDFIVTFSGTSSITCTAELRINGNVEVSGSAATGWANTDLISGDNKANRHVLDGFTNFQSTYYDDWYFKNSSGYYGDIRIIALYINGEGDTLQWTPQTGTVHYVMVNTHPADVTKYVETATPGNIDTYNWEDIPSFSGTVKAVNMGFLANKNDEGTKSFEIVFGNTGTEEHSVDFYVSSDTPEYYEHSNELDPATGLAWTQAGWNAKQAGIKLIT
jgi:hypothetical protein